MLKIVMDVEGMRCQMCEAHVNDAVRKAAPRARKVTSSVSKGRTEFLSEEDCSEAVAEAISALGYGVGNIRVEPYEKKGFFARFKK